MQLLELTAYGHHKVTPKVTFTGVFQDFLFDSDLLTDGAPPNDRGCRVCGKIGHFMRDCPVIQAKKSGSVSCISYFVGGVI